MGRLADIKAGQQLTLDGVLSDRDGAPPEATAIVKKGDPGAPAGADPDMIMADLETSGDISQAKIGPEPHLDGDCLFAEQCEPRRRKLSTYRPGQPCHWRAFWQWRDCPIYRGKNGGIS